jgi:hypothetical protein
MKMNKIPVFLNLFLAALFCACSGKVDAVVVWCFGLFLYSLIQMLLTELLSELKKMQKEGP